ncbi:helix-turn-helix domain-containing protein [Streptomyces sp. NPDC060322]|uniref:helix-turn-helix domain-containing protein n=1 Tax=Streptomyces sp. NPDC060322 TaxID=3347097 RepID=UPI0036567717
MTVLDVGLGEGSQMTGEFDSFGALLREQRMARSLTMEGLAELSGVSARGISDLERGRTAAPQRGTVAALADGLNLGEREREQLLSAARGRRRLRYLPAGVRSLPRGIDDFTGRREEVSRLAALAAQAAARAVAPGSAPTVTHPVVASVHGPPGAGKTTLALHTAREWAALFPDGQLLIDLRGTDPAPPGPAELIVTVLKALNVSDRDLAKAGPESHGNLYRQALADRRLLLVLDNARDEAQVRPLLPGAGATLTVITSRRLLSGLADVARIQVGELTPEEAANLLTSLAGTDRAAADAQALADVARQCGHLPLALRVAGNLLATRTGWSVRHLTDRLAQEERRLDVLTAGDLRVTAAFDLSYHQLTPDAARLFRRLALIPAPDTSTACAASLTGQDLHDTEDTLEELVETGLLGTDRDRYRLHDLLRLYARSKLLAQEPAADIEDATRQLHRWLLDTAVVAGRWYEPDHGAPPPSWHGTVDLSSADRARLWLQAEGVNWLAALKDAAHAGEHTKVVEVAESLHWFSDYWIFWGHWTEVFDLSARSAQSLGDPLLEATHISYLTWAIIMCEGRPEESLDLSARALQAARRAGDFQQQGWAHQYASWAHRLLKNADQAFHHCDEATRLFRLADDLHGQLQAMIQRAFLLENLRRIEEALADFQNTLAWLEATGDRIAPHIAAFARIGLHAGLGRSHTVLHRWDEAVIHHHTALEVAQEVSNIELMSRQLVLLGETLLAAGRPTEARQALTRCLALGTEANPQYLSDAARHLATLDGPG